MARNSTKTLIIGAGGGGISSAILAALRGESVTLYESHSKLGGCASWFKRGSFVFDAGATTLSGVAPHEPLGILFKLIKNKPYFVPTDPGIKIHLSNGKIINYYRDFDQWMRELEHHFPELDHRPFWKLVQKINNKSWKMVRDVPFSFFEILKTPKYWSLGLYLLVSTEMMLKWKNLFDPSYLELINGILIISAQAHAENIPFLVGSMGLAYPAETYAPVGGMKGLMDFFENEMVNLGIKIEKRTRIQSFTDKSITLKNGPTHSGNTIITNIPIWNLPEMTEGELKRKFTSEAIARPGSWGALVVYFGVEGEFTDLYQQIHLKDSRIKNYFVSFSIPNDESRAPKGFQAVTISTHVQARDFSGKEDLAAIIINDFKKRFNVTELKFLTTGRPQTFERYTGRKHGFVGGLPFLYGKNPFSILSSKTHSSSVYRVGDTVFPGQGLCGVVAGSLQLHQKLNSNK